MVLICADSYKYDPQVVPFDKTSYLEVLSKLEQRLGQCTFTRLDSQLVMWHAKRGDRGLPLNRVATALSNSGLAIYGDVYIGCLLKDNNMRSVDIAWVNTLINQDITKMPMPTPRDRPRRGESAKRKTNTSDDTPDSNSKRGRPLSGSDVLHVELEEPALQDSSLKKRRLDPELYEQVLNKPKKNNKKKKLDLDATIPVVSHVKTKAKKKAVRRPRRSARLAKK